MNDELTRHTAIEKDRRLLIETSNGIEWSAYTGRDIGYRGRPAKQGKQFTNSSRVSLIVKGRFPQATCQVTVDDKPFGELINVVKGAGLLILAALVAARETIGEPIGSPIP